mgnify:CR=1 FL=1
MASLDATRVVRRDARILAIPFTMTPGLWALLMRDGAGYLLAPPRLRRIQEGNPAGGIAELFSAALTRGAQAGLPRATDALEAIVRDPASDDPRSRPGQSASMTENENDG